MDRSAEGLIHPALFGGGRARRLGSVSGSVRPSRPNASSPASARSTYCSIHAAHCWTVENAGFWTQVVHRWATRVLPSLVEPDGSFAAGRGDAPAAVQGVAHRPKHDPLVVGAVQRDGRQNAR